MKSPQAIFELMYNNDPYSKVMGMKLISIAEGKCVLQLGVTESMLNGFGIAHGGISYALADSALAFASNSRGIQSLSIETSINHFKKVLKNDVLTATTEEKNTSTKTGLYLVEVHNQKKELVALFKGIVYRTGKEW